MRHLWYIRLWITAEFRILQGVLRGLRERYVKAFGIATAATHCAYFGLVSIYGHGLYVFPAAILMLITLFVLLSGDLE